MPSAAKKTKGPRYIWPRHTHCPDCKTDTYRWCGQNGKKQYRECQKCGNRYIVLAECVDEVITPGRNSVVRPIYRT